ncbi:MAG: hypothetical protein MZV63_23365 [Marinilabiliales bacterium]|nr:hypothetical protein [Marinilabiliales bacterium]
MRRTTIAAALTALVIVIVSCNPAKKYEEEEKDRIADYVAKNNITVNPDANGLYYIEIEAGNRRSDQNRRFSRGLLYTLCS